MFDSKLTGSANVLFFSPPNPMMNMQAVKAHFPPSTLTVLSAGKTIKKAIHEVQIVEQTAMGQSTAMTFEGELNNIDVDQQNKLSP